MAIPATTKFWKGGNSGNTEDWEEPMNWEGDSAVNTAYAWTVSGSGTNEYYLRTSAPADPSVTDPTTGGTVSEGDDEMTNGTVGSLSAGEWDYGDNDSLGYSTVYVRLTSGSADPDARSDHHVKIHYIPKTNDDIIVPARAENNLTVNIDTGLTITSLKVMDGFTKNIGTDTASLQVTMGGITFEYAGTGSLAKINFGASAVAPKVYNTGAPTTGEPALQLRGQGMTTCTVFNGDVAIGFDGASDEVDVLEVQQVDTTKQPTTVCLGPAVVDRAGTGDPDVIQDAGLVRAHCDVDVLKCTGGTYYQEEGKWATATVAGNGVAYIRESATSKTFTTTTAYPGSHVIVNPEKTMTFTTVNVYSGASWTDKNKSTYTNPINVKGMVMPKFDFGADPTIAPA